MMKKIVILIGSFCYNRGSEALVRGTIEIIKKQIPDSYIVLSSGEESFSADLNIENVNKYVRRQSYYGNISWNRLAANLYRRVFRNSDKADKIKYKHLLKECSDADLVIVCGGDNYDKSYHMYTLMHSVNQAIKSISKTNMIMYDCSLAESEITDDVKRDFALFDAITAREHDTFNAFKKYFPDNKVFYFPDPAFVMESKAVALPAIFEKGDVVGINLSTMAVESQYGSDRNTVLRAYKKMLDWILSETQLNVLLIPHVMRGLDLKILRELYEFYAKNNRVALLEDETLCARELKYIISHCALYVGARTHSTIAAYSSCVPTLVLGYSVKSIGIAKDLFGKFEGYVVPVNTIAENNVDILQKAFADLYENADKIREVLIQKMPDYKNAALQAGELFASFVQEKSR